MGTFSLEKVPIPLFNNHSYETAPSYSLYGLSHRQDPKTPLRETVTHFIQAITPVIPKPLPGSWSCWFSPEGGLQPDRKLAGFRPEGRSSPHFFFQAIKSKIGSFEPSFKMLEQPALYLSVISSCLAFLGWPFRGSASRLYSFPGPVSFRSFRRETGLNFLTRGSNLLSLAWWNKYHWSFWTGQVLNVVCLHKLFTNVINKLLITLQLKLKANDILIYLFISLLQTCQ